MLIIISILAILTVLIGCVIIIKTTKISEPLGEQIFLLFLLFFVICVSFGLFVGISFTNNKKQTHAKCLKEIEVHQIIKENEIIKSDTVYVYN